MQEEKEDGRKITEKVLEERIRTGISEAGGEVNFCEVVDVSGCGCGLKFEVVIVSNIFVGKPLLAQHRTVHKLIEEERKDIHALTLKTMTPASWEEMKTV